MKKYLFGGAWLLLTLSSCEKDEPNTPDPVDPGVQNVLISNEGNFQAGNASLGVYNLETETYAAKVFEARNGRPLGDVLQSINKINNRLYLVVNNSGKIEVLNPEDYSSTATISGLSSPRFILGVGNSLAYVSDLYSDSLAVVDLSTNTIDHYINISTNSERMLKVGNKVYVGHGYKTVSGVSVIDITTETVSKVIPTADYPLAMEQDKDGNVWVLCGGDAFNGTPGALEVIDPATDSNIKQLDLNGSSYINQMVFNEDRDSLYVLTDAVYKMSVSATGVPSTPLIKDENRSFNGMGFFSDRQELWLGDDKAFSQEGEVLIYSRSGKVKSSFGTGVGPNGFYFD